MKQFCCIKKFGMVLVVLTSFLIVILSPGFLYPAERWCENIPGCGDLGGCAAEHIAQRGCLLTCKSKLGSWIYKDTIDCVEEKKSYPIIIQELWPWIIWVQAI